MSMTRESLTRYGRRYGYRSLPARLLGRFVPPAWPLMGRAATSGTVARYLERSSNKILNLGSAGHLIEECLNADIDPRADVYLDARKHLPFPEASFDAVFAEEMIEHVSESAGEALLRECFRILVPGGIIRIATPDLDWFASRLDADDPLGIDINNVFYEHGHRYLYTRLRLRRALEKAGFVEIELSSYRDPSSVLGKYDSHADRFSHAPEISQFVDARKPR